MRPVPVPVSGKAYLYLPSKLNWNDAREACRDLGGDLAVIGTYREFEEIIPSLVQYNTHGGLIWVGAKLRGKDLMNDWYWVSGEPLSTKFKKWINKNGKITEPDVLSHDCAVIIMRGNERENNGPSLATIPCSTSARISLCQI